MNHLKNLGLLLLLALSGATAQAHTYTGSFIITYTHLNTCYNDENSTSVDSITGVANNAQYLGKFQYDSDTQDGLFSISAMEGSLRGGMYVPTPFLPYADSFLNAYSGPRLRVSGGSVTEFCWGFDAGPTSGGVYYYANNPTSYEFSIARDAGYAFLSARGSVRFLDLNRVPDALGTFGALTLSLAGLVCLRRRIRA